MQGQLSEIDIRSILQLLELGQRTGELYVEAYPDSQAPPAPPRSWLVFLFSGQIVYAGTTDGHLHRLRDYLQRYHLTQALETLPAAAIAPFNSPEYGILWSLLENHAITPAQGRAILSGMVHETLFDLLSLHKGSFVFKLSAALSPQLTTFYSGPLVATIMQEIQEWKQLHPQIQSLQQCPLLPPDQTLPPELATTLGDRIRPLLQGRYSLQQLARYLGLDGVTLAKTLYPHIRQGAIQLPSLPSAPAPDPDLEEWNAARVPRIVCVDDGITIRQAVEEILDAEGYEATSIGNPLRALSLLFQLQPDLILCDIAMPELEGYELCAMLRQSTPFRQTPIVMLTGKDGFIDRVKARMAGATDYLTKPFGAQELLTLVEKYVGLGNPQRPQPDRLLAAAIQDDLDLDASPLPPLS